MGNLKQRLIDLMEDCQEKDSEAQRLEGQLESLLDTVEEATGTRDLKEARKVLDQKEGELEKEWSKCEQAVEELEAEVNKMEAQGEDDNE